MYGNYSAVCKLEDDTKTTSGDLLNEERNINVTRVINYYERETIKYATFIPIYKINKSKWNTICFPCGCAGFLYGQCKAFGLGNVGRCFIQQAQSCGFVQYCKANSQIQELRGRGKPYPVNVF